MARMPPSDIYRVARDAGFSPDQAVTMTAIALAESGGDPNAHATGGEDSRGLWQINLAAHGSSPWAQGLDMRNPADNARAAFIVSREGADIRPWTVTHEARGAPFRQYLDEAQDAASANGEAFARGVSEGPQNYHDRPVAAGPASDVPLPPLDPDPPVAGHPSGPPVDLDGDGLPDPMDLPDGDVPGNTAPAHQGDPSVRQFLEHALAQQGDRYVFGHEVNLDDADPDTFDCSELVQWAAHQSGVEVPDGSWLQYLTLKQEGRLMSVEDALHTPGALLFRFSEEPTVGGNRPEKAHVAISLGDGRTIEAKGSAYGVGIFDAKKFGYAGVLPGFDYDVQDIDALLLDPNPDATPATHPPSADVTTADPPIVVDPAPGGGAPNGAAGVDSDHDFLADLFEPRYRLDPANPDTDGDGITDGYELLVLGTDATRDDSDFDGIADDVELALGTDPMRPDFDAGMTPAPDAHLDSDNDGISNLGERLRGTDPDAADSDGDGVSDADEVMDRTDPLDPHSVHAHPGVGGDPLDGADGLPGLDDSGLHHTGLDDSGLHHTGLDDSGLHHTGLDHSGLDSPGLDHSGLGSLRIEHAPLTGADDPLEIDDDPEIWQP